MAQTWESLLSNIRSGSVKEVDCRPFRRLSRKQLEELALALRDNRSSRSRDGGIESQGTALLSSTLCLETLDLWDHLLGAEGLSTMLAALHGFSVVTLDVAHNNLRDQGAIALANSLKDLRVKTLKLGNNGIGPTGASALAAALKGSTVETLLLSANPIEDEGTIALAAIVKELPLQTLALGNSSMGQKGLTALAATLKGSALLSLDLSECSVDDAQMTALAAGLKRSLVTSLNLSYNDIGDEGARALADCVKFTSLTEIDLNCTDIGQPGMQALLDGLRDSSVIVVDLLVDDASTSTFEEIGKVLEANRTRSFVLQLQVKGAEPDLELTFRTLGGAIAAVLTWNCDAPLQELPKAVWTAMQSSGFEFPSSSLSVANLRFVLPDGAALETGPEAAPLAQQLGSNQDPASSEKKRKLN